METKEDVIRLCQRLIEIESTNPGIGEGYVAGYIRQLLKGKLPEEGRFLSHEVEEGRPIVMAELPGKSILPPLVILCHMDTVPIASGWTKEPLGGRIEGGRLYGRGSCDMKGGMACALSAFLSACERVRTEGLPTRAIRFIGTMDEEADMKGIESAVELSWVDGSCLVMDTEPSHGEIQTAHRSRCWYRYRMHGRAAHASEPEKGVDAISAMAYALCFAREEVAALRPDAFCGGSRICFGEIRGGIHPYQVPADCECSVDMRLSPPYDFEKGREILEHSAKRAAERIPGVSSEIIPCGYRPAVPHHPDSELLSLLQSSIREYTGEEAVVSPFPGYTDSAVVASLCGNQNTLSYGPGSLAQAHRPDEYVELSELFRCEAVFRILLGKCF